MSKSTTHPITALRARESALLARLHVLDSAAWATYDESAHRLAIANARADAARGLIGQDDVAALIAARSAAAEAVAAQAPARAKADAERLDCAEELESVRLALAEELTAQAHRRRAVARERFRTAAETFRQHIEAAHALLPALVAAGVNAADEVNDLPSPMPRLVLDVALPVFHLETDGRQTITRLVFDPKTAEAAVVALAHELESVA